MTTPRRICGMSLLATVLLLSAVAVWAQVQPAAGRGTSPATPNNSEDLMRLFSAGLAGDAFGYDATEILYQAEALGVPTGDILPVFYIAHLAGESFLRVVELRTRGTSWGKVCAELGITADMLNRLAVPREVEILEPREVPDDVMAGLFLCSAMSQVFGVHPNEVFGLYQDGWLPLDVLAAIELGHRANRPVGRILSGTPRRMDWMREAQRLGITTAELRYKGGRCFNNLAPVVAEEPQQGDLEALYAMELVTARWDVPVDTVQRTRSQFLMSPPELVIAFYLADLARCSVQQVGETFAWRHGRRWGPTIVSLNIPPARFSGLGLWLTAYTDYQTADEAALSKALLAAALSRQTQMQPPALYSRFDSYFGPSQAILYAGVRQRYEVPFDGYYAWCRSGRPHHETWYFAPDHGDRRRSVERLGGRWVGTVVGEKTPAGGVPSPAPRPAGPGDWHPDTPRPHTEPPGFIIGERTGGMNRQGSPGGPPALSTPPAPVGRQTGEVAPAPRPRAPQTRPAAPAPTAPPSRPAPVVTPAPRTGPSVTPPPPAPQPEPRRSTGFGYLVGDKAPAPAPPASPTPQPTAPPAARPTPPPAASTPAPAPAPTGFGYLVGSGPTAVPSSPVFIQTPAPALPSVPPPPPPSPPAAPPAAVTSGGFGYLISGPAPAPVQPTFTPPAPAPAPEAGFVTGSASTAGTPAPQPQPHRPGSRRR